MLLHFTTVLRTPVGQYYQHRQSLNLVERQYTIIELVATVIGVLLVYSLQCATLEYVSTNVCW